MLNTRDAVEVLEHDFLEARCKILEIAAILDRIDRAPARHGEHPDARMARIRQAMEAILEPGRAAPKPFNEFSRSNSTQAGARP